MTKSRILGHSDHLNYALNRQMLLSAEWGEEAYIRVVDTSDGTIVSVRLNADPMATDVT